LPAPDNNFHGPKNVPSAARLHSWCSKWAS
jgi:hypothetical protein